MKIIKFRSTSMRKFYFQMAVLSIIAFATSYCYAESDPFPNETQAPTVENLLPNPIAAHYCSPTGNNTTGDGSIGRPWYDLRGGDGKLGPGHIVYFRGGIYHRAPSTWSLSENRARDAGTEKSPIIITNYPGEQVVYNDTAGWSLTLDGPYQILLGTKVSNSYGISINGGITVVAEKNRVIGVEFLSGADNGGDRNPAMISYPYNGESLINLHISHCYFHDSKNTGSSNIMAPIRMFNVTNPIIEFNIFKNNNETAGGGCVFHKDVIYGTSIIRFNKFINCESAITFGHQGLHHDSIKVYGNLFYDVEKPIENRHFMGTETNSKFEFYNNVALNLRTGFYLYQNHGNGDYQDRGQIYNNVIDGFAIRQGYSTYSNIQKNLPDIYDYNLWFSELHRSVMRVSSDGMLSLSLTSREEYFDHNVTTTHSTITYNTARMTATASDSYPGRSAGRHKDCIGGFTWGGSNSNSPKSPIGITVISIQ